MSTKATTTYASATAQPASRAGHRAAYGLILGSGFIYAALSLLAPSKSVAAYGLNSWQAGLIRLSIIIPIVLIWMVALRGILSFKRYARLIGEGAEAPGFKLITTALGWSLAYLVTITLLGALIPFTIGTHWLQPMVFVRNHLPVVITLTSMALLYAGSHRLSSLTGVRTWTRSTWLIAGVYAVAAATSTWLFSLNFTNAIIHGVPVTVVPTTLVPFTILLPQLIAWFLGLLAAVNITKYAHTVKGVLYRQALRDLVYGVTGVIVFGMALQLLSFAARFLGNLGLGPLLGVVYVLVALYGVGFYFVRRGAKRLARLEEAIS